MAHAVIARPRTRLDGRNLEPSLTAPASTASSTSTIFSDKLAFPDEPSPTSLPRRAFPDEPTSDEPTYSSSSSTCATSTNTIKREDKERPRDSDSGQALESRRELDGGHEWDNGQELDSGEELDDG